MQLPRDILDRVERVLEYHRASRHTPHSVAALTPRNDLTGRAKSVRVFADLPRQALPTNLLDLPVGAMSLLREGLGALPDSHVRPPQDVRTLASWLFMACGVTAEKTFGANKLRLRAYPSAGALYPCELYVAAFAIDGLAPGLHSFNPQDFSLTKLRDGPETLSQIKRGRPDLAFLKSVPAALLVSTIFSRSAWKYRMRGYRTAVLDAGHVAANLVAAANGLGIQTMTRLRMNDNTMRELIGIPLEVEFADAEAVQLMVVWADDAMCPMGAPPTAEVASGTPVLPPVPRPPPPRDFPHFGSVLAVHQDCVAPGVPIRELRAPVTEMSPLPEHLMLNELCAISQMDHGPSMRKVFMTRRSAREFRCPHSIPRDCLLAINRAGFHTGTFMPIHPDGAHVGLVRPFWVMHHVSGITSGIWYYHPPADQWVMVQSGDYRAQSQAMCLGQKRCGDAAAVCLMAAHLPALMHAAGPDAYRLAHLEAGLAGQRLALAATACGIGSCGIVSFYDDELRQFLGLLQSGWHVIYVVALGVMAPEAKLPNDPRLGIG